MDITLSEQDKIRAAELGQKMLKVAGKERPEIIANAAWMVIQLLCFVHGTEIVKEKT